MSRPGLLQAILPAYLVLIAGVVRANAATEPRPALAEESLALCKQGDVLAGGERANRLSRGLELAERAASLDPRDARAHLAIFCNLGKHMQASGAGLTSLLSLARLKREIDRSFELAPNDGDVLAAKGAFLVELPRALGGDAIEGERLLRAALALDPENGDTRHYLAEALHLRGADGEAHALAQ